MSVFRPVEEGDAGLSVVDVNPFLGRNFLSVIVFPGGRILIVVAEPVGNLSPGEFAVGRTLHYVEGDIAPQSGIIGGEGEDGAQHGRFLVVTSCL